MFIWATSCAAVGAGTVDVDGVAGAQIVVEHELGMVEIEPGKVLHLYPLGAGLWTWDEDN